MTAPNYGNPPGQGPLREGGRSVAGIPTPEENNLPSTPSAVVKAQRPALTLVRDLMEGNERVKDKRTEYLPQEPGEDGKNYAGRLQRSVFTNFFDRAIAGLTGLVFAKDPQLGDDVPPIIVEHAENIDLAGTHIDVFCRERFSDDLTAGHGAILVEYPKTDGKQTAADERDTTFPVRPYWVPILKDNIISWRTTTIRGTLVLTQLVLEECTMVADGQFGEKEQKQYRVFNREDSGRVTYRVLQLTERNVAVEVDAGDVFNQNEIPVAELITSGKKSLFVSKPPLVDLAFLNVAHYQLDSDYKNSIHKTCVPIYVESGVTPDSSGAVVLGTNTMRQFPDPQASAQYVSHDGAALGSVRQAIEDLKSDMATLSISMLAPQKRQAETAEAKRIDKAASDSALGVAARGLQDGIERALYFHAKYLKLESGGSISVNRDFEASVMDAATMSAFADFAVKLNVPVRAILEELQAGGRFVGQDLDDLEADIEAAAAAKQAQVEADLAAQVDAAKNGEVPAKAVA